MTKHISRSLVFFFASGLGACAGTVTASSGSGDTDSGGSGGGAAGVAGSGGGAGAGGGAGGGSGAGGTGGSATGVDAAGGAIDGLSMQTPADARDAMSGTAAKDGPGAEARPNTDALPVQEGGATGPTMKLIAGGTFTMGSRDNRDGTAAPPHQVTLSPFYMDITEVTQGQYKALMGVNPSFFHGDANLPVEQVTWYDAALYCNERSKREGKEPVYEYTSVSGKPGNRSTGLANLRVDLAKNGYRLPTEAEWEYAARAGTTTSYFWGEDTDSYNGSFSKGGGNYCWYLANAGNRTHPVGTKMPNPWGLFDMSGNAYEWTNDWSAPYGSAAQTDPSGPGSGSHKIARGGSFYDANLVDNRSAQRYVNFWNPSSPLQANTMGFRTVRQAR